MKNTDNNLNAIHIIIIEDHHEIREGLSFLLQQDERFSVLSFSNAEDAIKQIQTSKPSVVLMDINLPGIDGIEATKQIKKLSEDINIMMCTVYEDDEKIFKALSAGANGYILKRSAPQVLISSILELLDGGAPMSSSIARKVVDAFRPTTHQAAEANLLTDRENEILDLLAQGFRNKEIAAKLFLSPNTIRTHIYNIYEKLHVQNRIEALNKTGRKNWTNE